jgi:MFS family permease
VIFALFNSSDIFLLLRLKESVQGDTFIIGMYIFYNLMYAIFSFQMGYLTDEIGLKKVYMLGVLFFVFVSFGMAFGSTSNASYIILFLTYSLFAAATEGVSKAWISNSVNSNEMASALGSYAAFQSLSVMVACTVAGFVWFDYGPLLTFVMTGIAAIIVVAHFTLVKNDNSRETELVS